MAQKSLDIISDTVITKVVQPALTPQEAGNSCLVVFYGAHLGQRYFLEQTEQIIGRADTAHIQVDQESVSRHHVKIKYAAGRYWLTDLGSTNGTFINNQSIDHHELEDGDLLRVGQTIFKYLSGSNIESKYHEEIYRLSTMDGLTEIYNKRFFLDILEHELNRAKRYKRSLSLVMFDIDHFKKINDTFGHLAGDAVLRDMAALIGENLRKQDIFARYGGEEFAIILPEIDTVECSVVCEKLRHLVEHYVFSFGSDHIPVTVSIGITSYHDGTEEEISTETFIAHADEKLYAAKEQGRNRICA